MWGVIVMMIVVVSGVIVVIVIIRVAIMSGVAGGIVSAVTFSYGASCLCRDPRAMGARLWKP